MVRCATPVRRGLSDQHCAGHSDRLPPEARSDPAGESHLRVELRKELSEIEQLRLDLDDEKRSGCLMPAQQVDRPALPVFGVRNLGTDDPSQLGEPAGQVLGQRGVPRVDDAVQVDRARSRMELDPDVQDCSNGPDVG